MKNKLVSKVVMGSLLTIGSLWAQSSTDLVHVYANDAQKKIQYYEEFKDRVENTELWVAIKNDIEQRLSDIKIYGISNQRPSVVVGRGGTRIRMGCTEVKESFNKRAKEYFQNLDRSILSLAHAESYVDVLVGQLFTELVRYSYAKLDVNGSCNKDAEYAYNKDIRQEMNKKFDTLFVDLGCALPKSVDNSPEVFKQEEKRAEAIFVAISKFVWDQKEPSVFYSK